MDQEEPAMDEEGIDWLAIAALGLMIALVIALALSVSVSVN